MDKINNVDIWSGWANIRVNEIFMHRIFGCVSKFSLQSKFLSMLFSAEKELFILL